jgi:hypothetical protein
MLQKFISTLLLFCLSFQLSAKAIWVLNFELNKTTFIEQFCINKQKPNSFCEAKCYLKKIAEKEHETEQKIPGFIKEKETLVVIYNRQINSAIIIFSGVLTYQTVESFYSFCHLQKNFRPPTLA